ncbi:MAG: nucleotidyltransferase domain-containing protein [Acidobacteria bacterium]|jgi:predicted nucleotidyltransferase|nr:nucleotidyltransferase domain-containing protein [Acidobacteriota bacterium]
MQKINNQSLIDQLPTDYRKDIEKAIHILIAEGCYEIYLFGSLAKGKSSPNSDIDLAVKGLKDSIFFKVLGKLFGALDHPVDLLSLEEENRFITLLKKRGELLRVA